MIVRFNKRGKGGGSGPADYLMGKDRNRDGARVLRGDLEQTKQVIDSLNFARNYTSGCLSFEEDNIPEHQKNELMDSFESTVFAGLNRDQYEITWVEHTDKKRVELNYLIANVDLQSGKRYQPYYDKAERALVDSWQTIANAHYDYADPNDPARAAALTQSRDLPRDKQEASKIITDGLLGMAESGLVTSRKDVLSALNRHGFEVTRESAKFISIKDPSGGQNIRLKGGIYARDFKCGQGVRESIEARSREYTEEREQRIQQARQVYQAASARKREYNENRYTRASEPTDSKLQEDTFSNVRINDIDSISLGNVSTKDDKSNGIEDHHHDRRLQVDNLQQNNVAQQHTLLPTGVDINDRIRTTINNSIRQATNVLQLAIQRIERQTEQFRSKWRSQSTAGEEISRQSKAARVRQDMPRM